jgi:glycosyltransferase involved in cell wall biosynthesis
MQYLVVSHYIPPRAGGLERHTSNLVEYLAATPNSFVTVLTSRQAHVEDKIVKFDNVKLIKLDSYFSTTRFPVPKITLSNLKSLGQIRRFGHDKMFIQSHLFLLSTLAAIFFREIPKICWVNHGSGFVKTNNSIINLFLRFYEIGQIQVMSRFCTQFFAVSNESANWIAHLSKRTFEYVPNGIKRSLISSRENFPNSDSELKLLFVGRLILSKGALDALKFYRDDIYREQPGFDVSMTVVGDGADANMLKEFCKRNNLAVNFLGELDHSKVIEQMNSHDILLFFSDYPEGLPTVVLEAFASGMCVISNSQIGATIFKEIGPIFYLPFDSDVPKMPSILSQLKEQHGRQKQKQMRLSEFYTWEILIDKFL